MKFKLQIWVQPEFITRADTSIALKIEFGQDRAKGDRKNAFLKISRNRYNQASQ